MYLEKLIILYNMGTILFSTKKLKIFIVDNFIRIIFLLEDGTIEYRNKTITDAVEIICGFQDRNKISISNRDKALQKLCSVTNVSFGTRDQKNLLDLVTKIIHEVNKEKLATHALTKGTYYFKRIAGPLGYILIGPNMISKKRAQTQEELYNHILGGFSQNFFDEATLFYLIKNIPEDLPKKTPVFGSELVLGNTVGESFVPKLLTR